MLRVILTILILTIIPTTFYADSTAKQAQSSQIDNTSIFYHSLDNNYDMAKDALLMQSRSMQRIQGTEEGITRFYSASKAGISNKKLAKASGFYDKNSDTVFVNIDAINFKKSRKYLNALIKLNELRYDHLDPNMIIKKTIMHTRHSARALHQEIFLRMKSSKKILKSKTKMKDWVKQYYNHPDLLEGSQLTASKKNPIYK